MGSTASLFISPRTSTSPSLPRPTCLRCAGMRASEDAEGNQDSSISVFTRDRGRRVHHMYSAHPWMAEDVKERGIDPLTPVYNMLDLTPQGRDGWYAKLIYSESSQSPR